MTAILCIDPLTDARWMDVAEMPAATLFHGRPWMEAVAATYGFPVRACLALDAAGAVAAGLPYCELDDLCGRRIVALPFTDACDPLGSPEAVCALFAWLRARELPLQLRVLDRPLDDSWSIAKRARWHRLDVRDSPDRLWQGLAPSLRRAVRKAEREQVTVQPLADRAGVQEFMKLHVATRKHKYGLLAQPSLFFESLLRLFQDAGCWHALGAFAGGRLIAATIYLRWRDRLYYKFNASAREALPLRPNDLLLWKGVMLAQSLGCAQLDLGPSDDDQPGLIRFKAHTGAAEQELRFLRWTPPGWGDGRAAEARAMLRGLTRLLTAPEVPDDVSQQAGAVLYKYFA